MSRNLVSTAAAGGPPNCFYTARPKAFVALFIPSPYLCNSLTPTWNQKDAAIHFYLCIAISAPLFETTLKRSGPRIVAVEVKGAFDTSISYVVEAGWIPFPSESYCSTWKLSISGHWKQRFLEWIELMSLDVACILGHLAPSRKCRRICIPFSSAHC